jgi:nucleoside-diphosphate-sugar epimerase
VLLLGASGFVGAWVGRALLAAGAELHLAGRSEAPADVARGAASRTRLDLLAGGALEDLVARLAPRWIFNLAGYGVDREERDESVAERTNVELPLRLLRSALALSRDERAARRLVHAGTLAEYGVCEGELVEGAEGAPTTTYGRTKRAGSEALVRESRAHGLGSVVARLFMVYGPGEHAGRLVPSLWECARTRRPLPLTTGTQRRDFTYVEDAAEGLLRLGALPLSGEVVNVATGRLHSVREFAETAASMLELPRDLLRFGAVPTPAGEPGHPPVSIAKLRALANWAPRVTIERGLARTFERLREAAREDD